MPPLLTFGSWMGGDRDGNPHVTPAVTAEALGLMRSTCLRFLEGRAVELAGRVSLSGAAGRRARGARAAAGRRRRALPGAGRRRSRSATPRSPTGALFTFVRRARCARRAAASPSGYADPDELLADLRTAERTLQSEHGRYVAGGDLRDVIRQVEVFGFHFGRLDMREHADRHRDALAEILSTLQRARGLRGAGAGRALALLAREIG